MEPLTTAGAILGSLAQKVSPDLVICWLFVVVVGLVSARTWSKGKAMLEEQDRAAVDLKQSKKEETSSLIENEEQESVEPNPAAADTAVATECTEEGGDSSPAAHEEHRKEPGYGNLADEGDQGADQEGSDGVLGGGPSPELAAIYKEEAETPVWKIAINFMVLSGVFLFGVTRSQYTTCGSAGWWALIAANIGYIFAFSVGIHVYLVHRHATKVSLGYRYGAGDMRFDGGRSAVIGALCLVAGLFAGMFGVGGGLLKGPLMLEYGVIPEVATATAAFMLFFTTGTSAAAYAFFGLIPWGYATLFCVEGFIFGLVGQWLSNWMVKKHGKSAVLVLIMAGIGLVSVILMTIKGILITVAVGEGGEVALALC